MNNLHRDLAPVSASAWTDLEAEARRTFSEHVAGRRVVDVTGPDGIALAAVGTGHLRELDSPDQGVRVRRREVATVVELRVPFTVSREAVDAVERGAKDADWQPVKDAAKKLAFTEDRIIAEGLPAAGITGIRAAAGTTMAMPPIATDQPTAVAQAMSALRLDGVNGDYALLLSAEAYTALDETTEHGYPIRRHVAGVLGEGGQIIWAPALPSALLVSTRGGDYELHLGQDVSIGYQSHDDTGVELYLEESLTFLVNTPEAAVAFS
ncbi:bacteriocin family protein [Amycolatopsis acidiphila]|uniref:Type 1 encapsulin shell protein n=1 Tax=Amycolatopsis acidiphila TaxID=715473 RepID=A0A557ZXV7_9PSEU|nr:family 1 encapsulin nanocompartment shell protein [Amycolatopsis acidiphila]TVT16836.1 bacteriocin [Amycolatopsis acidiphila]UIJ63040.1 bacteriocin family protein [Amycolatopsis acidiphila]GHG65791.1 bacteriocin [Amycolatopsis acidiphila]